MAQTDNTYLGDKYAMRAKWLPEQKKIHVLDAFSADCVLWRNIKKNYQEKDISITRIEKKKGKYGYYLLGDNLKFLGGMDLTKYDIIDIDAYGVPFKQLEIVFAKTKNLKKTIRLFVTMIQSVYGNLPHAMLKKLGYTQNMISKCPTIFNRNGGEKFCKYLMLNGIYDIYMRSDSKGRNYLTFEIGGTWKKQRSFGPKKHGIP